ncbi:MAG: hypothetical protein J6J60_10495 [Clostridia bacterium]|nr:hypothetical protein [Clostridia bacterium]MBP3597800.1 hypothetical protein [Clostridia bacterium]
MKSKYIIFIFLIILIIFLIIIYNFTESGNNIISKSKENIIEKVLETKEYKSQIKVIVYSNKNQNEYIMEQYENLIEKKSSVKLLNESGLTMNFENKKLIISNTKLNLKKVYENYNQITKNYLFLGNFISEVDLDNIKETEKHIILNALENNNKYLHKKTLYINRQTNLPEKLIIIDDDQNVKTIIEYIEIELK